MIEKVLMRVLASAALAFVIFLGWQKYTRDEAELASLRDYKASVENRAHVSDAMRSSFANQESSAQAQKDSNTKRRSQIEATTDQVGHEDKATADFLAMPIPERLRAADRQARLAGRLGPDQRTDGADGQSDPGRR